MSSENRSITLNKVGIPWLPDEEIAMAPEPKPLTEAELKTIERILQIEDYDEALDATPAEILDRVTGIGTDPEAGDIRGWFD